MGVVLGSANTHPNYVTTILRIVCMCVFTIRHPIDYFSMDRLSSWGTECARKKVRVIIADDVHDTRELRDSHGWRKVLKCRIWVNFEALCSIVIPTGVQNHFIVTSSHSTDSKYMLEFTWIIIAKCWVFVLQLFDGAAAILDLTGTGVQSLSIGRQFWFIKVVVY